MKRSSLFTPALGLAFGLCASAALAVSNPVITEDFSGDAFDGGVDGVTTNKLTWADPGEYSYVSDGQKLVVDATTDQPTSATIDSTVATNFNGAIEAAGRTASFTAKVNFTPATETPEIGGADLKFALYAKAAAGSTNLMVLAKPTSAGVTNEIDTGFSIDCSTDTTVSVNFTAENTFEVAVGSAAAVGPYYFANNGTIAKVEFAGNGDVDDIGFSYDLVDTTITWPTTMTVASYTVDGGESVALVANSGSATVSTEAGAAIALTLTNADGATKTINGTAGTAIDATAVTFGWADYLGAAVAGAYQIDDFADLDMLRKGVAAGLATSGITFKQTADIDMASAGAFAGIGTFSKVPTSGTPFTGTYNGQGYTIKNVTRAGGNTQGVFNQVGVGGTIENLVVSNMVFDAGLTGEYGFAIVGNAGGGATLRNLTAAGVFGAADKPSTHNIAGIVVRLSPGATVGAATTIDSCTNNATIYGGYTKLGGICAIAQTQSGFADGKVVFIDCANNGALVCKRTAQDVTGNAGIVAYSSAKVELTGCYGNGVITNSDGANTDKDGALVGWQYSGYSFTDNGGNSAPANKKMIAYYGNVANVTGFQYATVDNGVATTISGALAAGNTYLLEGNAAPTFQLAAAGDTIAFDTALGYTLTDTGITVASSLKASNSTSGTVKTYGARAYATVTVTVTGGANATAAWTVDGVPAAAPATLTEDQTYSVTYTANEGYEFADGAVTSASGTAGTENITITIADAVASVVPYGDGDGEIPAIEVSGGATHTLTDGEADYLNDLVEAKGGTAAAQEAVEAAAATITEQAFADAVLLNQDITDDGFRGGTAKFEISNIRNVTGGIEITVKLQPASKMLGNTINGHVNLYAYNPLSGEYVKQDGKEFTFTFANPESPAATTATVTFTGDYSLFKAVIEE